MKYDFLIDDMTWSYSRLTNFEQCNYGWLLNYIYHEERRSGFFAEYGSFMHDIIAKALTGQLEKSELASYFAKNFRKEVPTPATSPELKAKYFAVGKQYLRDFDFPHKKIVAVEEPVRFKIEGVPFVGYIDVISEENGELVITDHKSHDLKPFSKKYPEKKTKTDLELEAYLRQLILYAVGVKKKYGRYPAMLEFNCFKSGQWISVPFDESLVQPTIDWVLKTCKMIRDENEWKPNMDYFFCKNLCDVRDACEYWNEE